MKYALKIILITLLFLPLAANHAKAQNVGLSFSFFFPKNGEFSTPISPFSFRGVGFNLNRFVGVETGFSLYRMTGMGLADLPFESKKSLVGPNFTLLVPLELVFTVAFPSVEMSVKGGGFGFYSFANKLKNGNLDRAIASHYGYELVNSSYEGAAKLGLGYHFGGEIILYVFPSFGLSFEGNYFIGGADYPLTGSYKYYDGSGVTTVEEGFPDSRIDMTGLELSIGVIMTGNSNKAPRKRRR